MMVWTAPLPPCRARPDPGGGVAGLRSPGPSQAHALHPHVRAVCRPGEASGVVEGWAPPIGASPRTGPRALGPGSSPRIVEHPDLDDSGASAPTLSAARGVCGSDGRAVVREALGRSDAGPSAEVGRRGAGVLGGCCAPGLQRNPCAAIAGGATSRGPPVGPRGRRGGGAAGHGPPPDTEGACGHRRGGAAPGLRPPSSRHLAGWSGRSRVGCCAHVDRARLLPRQSGQRERCAGSSDGPGHHDSRGRR